MEYQKQPSQSVQHCLQEDATKSAPLSKAPCSAAETNTLSMSSEAREPETQRPTRRGSAGRSLACSFVGKVPGNQAHEHVTAARPGRVRRHVTHGVKGDCAQDLWRTEDMKCDTGMRNSATMVARLPALRNGMREIHTVLGSLRAGTGSFRGLAAACESIHARHPQADVTAASAPICHHSRHRG